jgi:hypothetical protein
MNKWLLITTLIVASASCAHYSTADRSEPENIINAPVDIVWERTLDILPTERMTLKNVNKDDYFIEAKKHITAWSWGDEISIRLIPKGEKQTIMQFSAGTVWGWGDFGHEGRMVKSIFDRIKTASESSAAQQ